MHTHTDARNTMNQESFLKPKSLSGQHSKYTEPYWLQSSVNFGTMAIFENQSILCCLNVENLVYKNSCSIIHCLYIDSHSYNKATTGYIGGLRKLSFTIQPSWKYHNLALWMTYFSNKISDLSAGRENIVVWVDTGQDSGCVQATSKQIHLHSSLNHPLTTSCMYQIKDKVNYHCYIISLQVSP